MSIPLRIDGMTWQEYQELVTARPIILPIGATEQHGRHLPLGTDALSATAFAEAVSAANGALVAPTLAYGYRSIPRSGGGEEFPGTTGLSMRVVVDTIHELLSQFADDGASQICILSGHMENQAAIHEAAYTFTREQERVRVMTMLWGNDITAETFAEIYPEGVDFPGIALEHAAFIETSLMLYLHPELVREERASSETANFPPFDVYPADRNVVPESGSLAPATGATTAAGERIFRESVAGLLTAMQTVFGGQASTS